MCARRVSLTCVYTCEKRKEKKIVGIGKTGTRVLSILSDLGGLNWVYFGVRLGYFRAYFGGVVGVSSVEMQHKPETVQQKGDV